MSQDRLEKIREQLRRLLADYHQVRHADQSFIPGTTPVPVSGKVYDESELFHLLDATLDFWLTSGRFAHAFERELGRLLEDRPVVLCNSGSSANLLAVSALTSPSLGERALRPGDEVITTAACFPTTVNPIVQNRLVPVFIDVSLPTYNARIERLEEALSPRTRAVLLTHTLGNPFEVAAALEFSRRHNVFLVEDCCDALGSSYDGKPVGTFGSLATFSFYPAHQITMGEGGAVVPADGRLKKILDSFRDWGRDCWCDTGKDNTCGKRFGWELGGLPAGYDHKYLYSHIGYNLKLTDLQASIGLAQIAKLPLFSEQRKKNFAALQKGLLPYQEFIHLPEPTPRSDPNWFGFPITVREKAPFPRDKLVRFLENKRIATRMLFAGNITRQPAYRQVDYRVAGPLDTTDAIMQRTFWVGIYPGLTEPMRAYQLETFREFFHQL